MAAECHGWPGVDELLSIALWQPRTTNDARRVRRPPEVVVARVGSARKKRSAAQATSDREVQGLLLIAAGRAPGARAVHRYDRSRRPISWRMSPDGSMGLARYLSPLAFLWLGWHRLRTAPMPRTRSRKKRARRLEPAQVASVGDCCSSSAFSILDLVGGRPWNGSTVAGAVTGRRSRRRPHRWNPRVAARALGSHPGHGDDGAGGGDHPHQHQCRLDPRCDRRLGPHRCVLCQRCHFEHGHRPLPPRLEPQRSRAGDTGPGS